MHTTSVKTIGFKLDHINTFLLCRRRASRWRHRLNCLGLFLSEGRHLSLCVRMRKSYGCFCYFQVGVVNRGLLLASISSQGRAEFADQERCAELYCGKTGGGGCSLPTLLTGSSSVQDQAAGSYRKRLVTSPGKAVFV